MHKTINKVRKVNFVKIVFLIKKSLFIKKI